MALFTHIDWEQVSMRTARETWAQQVLDTMCTHVNGVMASGITPPDEPGGWIHDFVCPDHWLQLDYDRGSPTEHICPQGDRYTGEPYNAAWRVLRHRELADAARDAGVLYRVIHDSKYCDTAFTVLHRYATVYRLFAGETDAQPWMLKGRAFNQALTEALWAVPIAQTYSLIAPALTLTDSTYLRENLLRPIANTLTAAYDQLLEQERKRSNYMAWIIAALGCLGFALNDGMLVDRAINAPGGFCAHFAVLINPDGLEYEGSTYYHNFVTLAYLMLAEAAQGNGFDLYAHRDPATGCSIADMYTSLSMLAWPDGSFPQLNDGAYWTDSIFDAELCAVFEVAFARSQKNTFAWLLEKAYARRGVNRDSWLALLLGQQPIAEVDAPPLRSVQMVKSGIAMLHTLEHEQTVCVPFGTFGDSHHHYDRLSPVIWPWSRDAGNPPYGVAARRDWYQQTAAHNGLLVDGHGQEPTYANLVSCQDDKLILESDTLYPGVKIARSFEAQSGSITDVIKCASNCEHTYTWLCHADLETMWEFDGAARDVNEPLTAGGAGAKITLLRTFSVLNNATLYGRVEGGGLEINIATAGEFMLGFATCPGNTRTPYLSRWVLVAQQHAQNCIFSVIYKFE